MYFDFTGATFDSGDFSHADFSGSFVSFIEAEFAANTVFFTGSQFCDGRVSFDGCKLTGGGLDFRECVFLAPTSEQSADPNETITALRRLNVRGHVYRVDRDLNSCLTFIDAKFNEGSIDFSHSHFKGGIVDFWSARFDHAYADFTDLKFEDGRLDFLQTQVTSDQFHMDRGIFSGGTVSFDQARFFGKDSYASFRDSEWSGAYLELTYCKFAGPCLIDFEHARFLDGVVDFTESRFAGARGRFDEIYLGDCALVMKDTEYYDRPQVTFSGDLAAGSIDFEGAKFYNDGVSFRRAQIAGTLIDFSRVGDWAHPPDLPDGSSERSSVLLPQSPAADE
jgi:uncharacterized protein YjbI with pentapeptide repeats